MNGLHVPITLALSFSGFAALSLAMDRHFHQATGRQRCAAPWRWALRLCGCAMLLASLRVCLSGWGTSVGVVAWWGLLTLAAMAVVLGLSYRPRRVPVLAVILGSAATLALAGDSGITVAPVGLRKEPTGAPFEWHGDVVATAWRSGGRCLNDRAPNEPAAAP